jgi:hypothetical protein
MRLYEIPDIRLFWSIDPGFLHQFKVEDPYTPITYKVSTSPIYSTNHVQLPSLALIVPCLLCLPIHPNSKFVSLALQIFPLILLIQSILLVVAWLWWC